MEPELKYYTVSDLKQWLLFNNPVNGLSEMLIAPQRAFSIINNPYVKDADVVVCAIFEEGELAAYTASFPDNYNNQRVWWATTLWCNPKYQGQGYGMIVVGSLMEIHSPELTFDRWGASETVEIFNCFGMRTLYTKRFYLGDKAIRRGNIKGDIAYVVQQISKYVKRKHLSDSKYKIQCSDFIDGETYYFMLNHKGNDFFLREQKMLNWILQYPFMHGCILEDKLDSNASFSSNVRAYVYSVVKIYHEQILSGVYILRNNSGFLSVLSIYYQQDKQNVVFSSIADYMMAMNAKGIITEDIRLFRYLHKKIFFPRVKSEFISFSVPASVNVPDDYSMQLIDGDSFA